LGDLSAETPLGGRFLRAASGVSPAVTKFARMVLSAAVRAALAGYRVAIGYARVR
jgi:hypothetical protein